VDCEKSVPDGQLDIVVQSRQLRFLMVVENKIDAYEQDDQIARYQAWLNRRNEKLYPPNKRVLLYLTPYGRLASTASSTDYCRFSYSRDIVAWLRIALPEVQAPRVRDAIIQYLDLIRDLFPFKGSGRT
jgi:hypothetical protein